MSEILIPFAGEFLALSREQLEQAIVLGRKMMPSSESDSQATDRSEILDADGMEQRTGIPATWWLEQARRDAIPHIRAGKYVRFELAAALDALRSRRPTVRKAGEHGIRLTQSGG